MEKEIRQGNKKINHHFFEYLDGYNEKGYKIAH
jgi:hypothetical protein